MSGQEGSRSLVSAQRVSIGLHILNRPALWKLEHRTNNGPEGGSPVHTNINRMSLDAKRYSAMPEWFEMPTQPGQLAGRGGEPYVT